jgi:purine-binding chemotaxis protein CheW
MQSSVQSLPSTATHTGDIAAPYLTFQLGEQEYALAIAEVVEVAAMVEPMPLAAAPLGVVGMANRRGEPILLVDLQRILSGSTAAQHYDVNTLFIVVQPEKTSSGSRFGVLVDSVRQVEYFVPSSRTPLPHQQRNPVQAVISVDDRMIQLLDVSQLIQPLFGAGAVNSEPAFAFTPAASSYSHPSQPLPPGSSNHAQERK